MIQMYISQIRKKADTDIQDGRLISFYKHNLFTIFVIYLLLK